MSADLNAIKARRWDSPDALKLGDLASARIASEDIVALLAEVERLRAAINEYDPATALHEMLDIDPTDPVNARAHRKAHERQMGEWHGRVVGRDKVINEVKVALTQGISTDRAARDAAVRVIDNWLNRDLDASAHPKFEAFKARKLQAMEPLKSLVAQRKTMGLTQAQVAERMGVTQPTVAQFEAGTDDPRMSTLRRYALAVGAEIRHHVTTVAPDTEATPC